MPRSDHILTANHGGAQKARLLDRARLCSLSVRCNDRQYNLLQSDKPRTLRSCHRWLGVLASPRAECELTPVEPDSEWVLRPQQQLVGLGRIHIRLAAPILDLAVVLPPAKPVPEPTDQVLLDETAQPFLEFA